MEEILQLIERYGFWTVLAVAFGLGGFLFGRAMFRRLFDEDKGILTKAGEAHVRFVDTVNETNKTQATASVRIADAAEATTESVKELTDIANGNKRSADRLHVAGVHACDVLRHVCDKLEISSMTSDSINAIQRELERT